MAERNEKVYQKVRQELMKGKEIGSRELHEMAAGMDKKIGEQSVQQFHARYVLPVKREQAKARGGGRRRKKAAPKRSPAAATGSGRSRSGRKAGGAVTNERDQVRTVLLQFAQDFSGAETKSEVVRVMSRMDEYVDEITKSFR